MNADDEARYRAVAGRDRRFDGVFFTAVRSTGIYCRPSCPARTPKPHNVAFYPSAAAAQTAGFRACRRCLPDATPGSPLWDLDAAVADRAMRLINDGVVERSGVEGLAGRLGFSTRQLNRIVTRRWGAGPLALARARRAQTARVLIETSDLLMADVAFASGFTSIRSFNDTVREVYAVSPSRLRGRPGALTTPGRHRVRIAVREPFAGEHLLGFLAARAIPGVERVDATSYTRTVRLPHGHGAIRLELTDRADSVVPATIWLADLRDLSPALERTRRLLDADCDPVAVDATLGVGALADQVRHRPGLRVPGHVDPGELAVRAVLGQQVSVAGARTLATRLVRAHGTPLALPGVDDDVPGLLFPDVEVLAGIDPTSLAMPNARSRALVALAGAIASGEVRLDLSMDRAAAREALLDLPGIGPWTAGYIAMRALGDPDVFLSADLVVKRTAARLGIADLPAVGERWRPWRSYALMHLWAASAPTTGKN